MTLTPDRRPGEGYEEGIVLDNRSPGDDPTEAGGIRYVDGSFRMKDGTGVFDPRTGGSGLSNATPQDVDTAAGSAGVSTDASRADHKHDVATAAPAATGVATASGEGTATSLARSDHTHQSNTAPVNVTKDTAAIGTSGEPARADHKHDVTTAAPAATGVATASGEGSATSLARSDHTHQANTAPANVTKSTAAIGTSGEPARADHKHDVTTAAPSQGIGGGNSEGSSSSLARADHDHKLRTTTGPTDLTIGAVADGEYLVRSGTSIIGGTPGGGTFGTEYQYAESTGQSSTTGTTLTTKVTMTTPTIPAGDYYVAAFCEAGGNASNLQERVELRVDSTRIVSEISRESSTIANALEAITLWAQVTLTNATHTIDLRFAREAGAAGTVYCQAARIVIWRVA